MDLNRSIINTIIAIVALVTIITIILAFNTDYLKELRERLPLFAKDHENIKTQPRWFPDDAAERLNISGEVETISYSGQKLTPISEQRKTNKSIAIDKKGYELEIYGLVNESVNLTYEQIKLEMPRISKIVDMHFIDGEWFTAKWDGVMFWDIIAKAKGELPGARYATFYSADGTTTQLTLNYLIGEDIILAYKDNDITLAPEQGFPLMLVAEGKYDYKWAKWITKIEITDKEQFGTVESQGYSNLADIDMPAK